MKRASTALGAIAFSLLTTSLVAQPAEKLEPIEVNTARHTGEELRPMDGGVSAGAWVAAMFLSAAESAIRSKLQSVISDALFGSSGPNYVHLSQQSLDAIADIVREENFRVEKARFLTRYHSFGSHMDDYQAGASMSNPHYDLNLLETMRSESVTLSHHHLFDANFNPAYFTATDTFASVAGNRVAVAAERHLRGLSPETHVRSIAHNLAPQLSAMGAVADSYIASNVRVIDPPWGCEGAIIFSDDQEELNALQPSNRSSHFHGIPVPNIRTVGNSRDRLVNDDTQRGQCVFRVRDDIEGRSASFSVNLWGYHFAQQKAHQLRNQWMAEYRELFKGGSHFHAAVQELENF